MKNVLLKNKKIVICISVCKSPLVSGVFFAQNPSLADFFYPQFINLIKGGER